MAWFFGQSLLFVVLAFLLGLLVGYLIWGRFPTRRRSESTVEPATPAAAPPAPVLARPGSAEPALVGSVAAESALVGSAGSAAAEPVLVSTAAAGSAPDPSAADGSALVGSAAEPVLVGSALGLSAADGSTPDGSAHLAPVRAESSPREPAMAESVPDEPVLAESVLDESETEVVPAAALSESVTEALPEIASAQSVPVVVAQAQEPAAERLPKPVEASVGSAPAAGLAGAGPVADVNGAAPTVALADAPPADAPDEAAPAIDLDEATLADAPVEVAPATDLDEAARDDLQRVEGIGPKMPAALHAAGIQTYRQLADADRGSLQKAISVAGLSFAPSLPTWSRQARLLADADEAGLADLQRRLIAGREIDAPLDSAMDPGAVVAEPGAVERETSPGTVDGQTPRGAVSTDAAGEPSHEPDDATDEPTDTQQLTDTQEPAEAHEPADTQEPADDMAESTDEEPGTVAATTAGGAPVPDDDLQRIEGIGPRMSGALRAAGIRTFRQLAGSDDATIRAAIEAAGLRFAPSLVTWGRQAALLAAGDEDGLADLQRRLVAGRDVGRV